MSEKHKYQCVVYENWNGPEGWYVNDAFIVEEGIYFDPDDCTNRELYKFFARIADYKTNLRSIEIEGDWDYFIEFIYTGRRLGGFFPLGRFERTD